MIGMDGATVRYDPGDGAIRPLDVGQQHVRPGPAGNVWHTDDGGPLFKVDTSAGTITKYAIPTNDGVYDMDTDSKGRTLINIWRNGKIGRLRSQDGSLLGISRLRRLIPVPRRGEIDTKDRLWVAEYYSGRLAMFDPAKPEIKEFALIPGTKAYTAPYLAPYTTTVDDTHQLVWTTDFNSARIFRFDMKTEKTTEFFMPGNYEVRDLTAEPSAPRPTFWITFVQAAFEDREGSGPLRPSPKKKKA